MDFRRRGRRDGLGLARLGRRWRVHLASAAAGIGLLAVTLLLPDFGHAQGTSITSSGLGTVVNGNTSCVGGTCNITGGARSGPNLFHSFGSFSIGAGDTANFLNTTPALPTQNILSRVTGGALSQIYGTIDTSSYAGANLFLLNPAGLMFGAGATLNMSGAFYASTANQINFPGGQFTSTTTAAELANPAFSVDPASFGFLGPPTAITVQGLQHLQSGQTVSLVGGDIEITGTVRVPSGRVQIASVASAGEVSIGDLSPSASTQLGQVNISGGAQILATGDAASGDARGGTVLIRGGQINIGGSTIDASGDAANGGAGGAVVIRGGSLFVDSSSITVNTYTDVVDATVAIDVQMAEGITLTNGTGILTGIADIGTQAFGAGRGGDIRLEANQLTIQNGMLIGSSTFGAGGGGNVQLTASQIQIDGSSVSSSAFGDGGGGNVSLTANTLVLPDGSTTGGTLTLTNFASVGTNTFGAGRGGDVQLSGQEQVGLSGGASVVSQALADGRGGDIVIIAGGGPGAGSIEVTGLGSNVTSVTVGPGRGGDIRLTAGQVAIGDSSAVVSGSLGGEGVGGDVTVVGGTVSVTGGGSIQSLNQNFGGGGRGGNISVQADDSITISGQDAFGGSSLVVSLTDTAGDGGGISLKASSLKMDGGQILSSATFGDGPGGAAGAIAIEVGQLTLNGGGLIRSFVSTTVPGVPGTAGDVTVTVAGQADIAGPGTGIFSFASQSDPADITTPGNIVVDVSTLRLTDGALIQGGSFATDSQGGNVTVRASDSILINGGAGISSQAFNLPVGEVAVSAQQLTIDSGFINTGTLGDGRAGNISVDVGTLTLSGGGQIASSSSFLATGAGGNVTVNAKDSVTISGSSPESVLPLPFRDFIQNTASGIFSTASSQSPQAGAAGSIIVSTPTLTMADGGTISVATSGAGDAGNIGLNVGNFSLTTGARVDSGTTGSGKGGTVTVNAAGLGTISSGAGFFSNAEGSGAGGNLNIQAAQLQLLDGATISARSTGTDTARAGDVNIVSGSLLRMVNSSITTEAAVADGGNISITTTGSTLVLADSQIKTSVQSGVGQGGNITIGSAGHPFDFILLGDSQIRADAFGGPGGNINMFAKVYLTSNSVVSASSALSTPGTIAIEATVTDVSGSLTQLPTTPLEAAALMRASCAARLAGGKTSSLVVAGREGLPLDPSSLLPSPLIVEPPVAALAPDEEFPWLSNLLRVSYLSLDPKCLP